MLLPLLPTKLYVPALRPGHVRRPALIEKFDAEGLYPLTLIAAPAGFGKTSLVAEWIAQRDHPVAWLALQEDDNDIGRFLTYFLGTLRAVSTAELGDSVLALLQSAQPPPLRQLLDMLAQALIAHLPRCVLVLDDYHVVNNQSVHDTVIFLLEHVPALRWIITTRADPALPLGRLRARRQLLELRAADLQFGLAETAELLNDVLELALASDAVQELQSKTEGWVAGLQLAGLAMHHSADRSRFVREFIGSHRYIADYLADEVLHQLSVPMQRFLLQTAILERLCGEVCAALMDDGPTEQGENHHGALAMTAVQAQLCLEELEHANLFLIPLDDNRRWYRYHHLFADLLRQRLHRQDSRLVARLHRKAATWFAQNNLLDDAIPHAIAGQDFAQAADLLERSNELFWMQGRFATLQHWLSLLPSAVKEQQPRLLLAQAWTHVLTDSAANTIVTLLQDAEKAISRAAAINPADAQPTTTELQGILATIRAIFHSKQEDVAGVMVYAQQALAQLPRHDASWRGIAQMCLGFANEINGSARSAQQNFEEAIRLCRLSENHYSALVSTMRLARTYLVQGQLHLAAATYQEGLAEATQRGMVQLPNTALANIYLGRIYYEWNKLADAAEQLQVGLSLLQGYGASWLQFDGLILLARVKEAQGQRVEAIVQLEQAEQVAQSIPFSWTAAASAALLIQARLALGLEADIDRWLAHVAPTPQDKLNRVRESEHLVAVRVLTTHSRSEEALALLANLTQHAEAAGRVKTTVECYVLTAVAYYRSGDYRSAQVLLHKALALAQPEGYIRSFVDEGESVQQILLALRSSVTEAPMQEYVQRIMAAYKSPRTLPCSAHPQPLPASASAEVMLPASSAVQGLVEPLSARELEILQLMAAGLSNQEIAEQLVITVGTVKSHANHIFGKLGVQGRVKAINQARALALI